MPFSKNGLTILVLEELSEIVISLTTFYQVSQVIQKNNLQNNLVVV